MPVRRLFGSDDVVASPTGAGLGKPLSCVACGLYKEVETPRMPPFGDFQKQIMIVGEAPGETEDKRGKPWQGRAGNVIKDALDELGIDLFKDCISLNAVNCRPPKNRAPTGHEVNCCRARIVNPAIAGHPPKIMLLLGGSAVSSVIGALWPEAQDAPVGKWRGLRIPAPELGAWLCPTYHPSYVMREEKKLEVETVWKKDLKQALKLLDTSVPGPENLRDRITILRDEESILRALHRVRVRKGLFSFDFETTGFRAEAHKLVCVSFCQSVDRAYSFMLDNASAAVRQAFREILLDDEIGKISHNLSFEYEWCRAHFNIDEIKWEWDSMLAAHVVDNRPGICGLKHQSFLNFGVLPYDDLISPYLKSTDPKDPTSWNRIYEFIDRYGEDEVLIYCGIDSLMAFRLTLKQMEFINEND
jgi:uracil-DNA glycosylase family 4